MTKVRTFKASSMQEALDLIRDELGTEAVILHTRQTSARRLLPWRKPKAQVEVTAGLGVNVRGTGAAPPKQAAPSPKGEPRYEKTTAAESRSEQSVAARALASASSHGDAGVELQLSQTTPAPSTSTLREPLASTPQPSSPPDSPSTMPTPTQATLLERLRSEPVDHNAQFADKLDSIQKMLANLERSRHGGGVEEVPSELFHLYTELIDADVEDELACELIAKLKRHTTPDRLADAAASKAMLTGMVESEIQCCAPITPTPGRRKVVALVGPTGVGKTTTIAKLAANFRLRDGVRMGLVTVDTYRIAAVEQLRTYAEIIDLPMKVVTSPIEMRRALDELSGLDLVLIDTAGRSPRDELRIQELKSLLAEADVDEVHLVLSLTSSIRGLEATARKFAAANTTSIILTKLDEAAAMGALLSIARRIPHPVSYLTTGQDVPEDIEPANPARIARFVLGQDKLFD